MKLTAIALAVSLGMPAWAQAPCAEKGRVHERLSQVYGETLQSHGLSAGGYMLEIWGNTETGSWSVVRVLPDGMACLVDLGQAFSDSVEQPEVVNGEAL